MRKDGRMFLAGKSATEGRTSDDTLPNPDNAKLRSSEHIKICIGEHCDEDRLLYYCTIIDSARSTHHIERVARPALGSVRHCIPKRRLAAEQPGKDSLELQPEVLLRKSINDGKADPWKSIEWFLRDNQRRVVLEFGNEQYQLSRSNAAARRGSDER